MVQCAKVKTGGKGDDIADEDQDAPAPGPSSVNSDAESGEASAPAPDTLQVDEFSPSPEDSDTDGLSPSPDTAFGGEGSLGERLFAHAGLVQRMLLIETSHRQLRLRHNMRHRRNSARRLRDNPEAAEPSKIVNGVEVNTGSIRELSCYLAPRRISDLQTGDSFGYVQINTISMGSSTPPPMNVVVAGASGGEAGVEAVSGSEGGAKGDLGAAANLLSKCPLR